jgi:hypothetical protein
MYLKAFNGDRQSIEGNVILSEIPPADKVKSRITSVAVK